MAIKDLVSPEHDDHFVLPDVGDVVRPSGHGFYDFCLAAISQQLIGFTRIHMAELEAGLPLDDEEFLGLGVVVVAATGNARLGGKEGELTAVRCLEHFDEDTTRISMLLDCVGEAVYREVADIGSVEGTGQAGAYAVNHQRIAVGLEALDGIGQMAYGSGVDRLHGFKAIGIRLRLGTVHELDKAANDIVHIDQADGHIRVVDLDGQVTRHVMAESGHNGVVVGAGPFAKDIGQAEQVDRAACLV